MSHDRDVVTVCNESRWFAQTVESRSDKGRAWLAGWEDGSSGKAKQGMRKRHLGGMYGHGYAIGRAVRNLEGGETT